MADVTVCGVCGSPWLDTILDMGDQPLAEAMGSGRRYPLTLVQCRDCTLVQLGHVVDQAVVFPPDHPYATGNTAALRRHFTTLAGTVRRYLQPGGLIADIGANDGTFLRAVSDVAGKVRMLAVEPTNQAAKCPGSVYQEFFTAELGQRIRDTHGPASVVTACNVLAHVPDPHDFIKGVTGMLTDDGVFVTENHDWASAARGLQIDTVYHEHLRYYTVTSLARLLSAHGLEVVSAEPVATHGGSVRVTARKAASGLQGRAAAAADGLHALIAGIDGPVYGISAATRATPLIHYARIAPFIACVCEVSSSEKIGHVMPGTAIPVVDESRLIEDQPPYAVLFAWHIRDTLIPRLRSMGYRGRFIQPLPEAVILDD